MRQALLEKWLRHDVDVEPTERIYVNRNLKMASIEAVGFDMDHTLAIYRPEPFEELAYRKAQEKLVRQWGYPREVLRLRYEKSFVIRGLVVDTRLGNILKMDEHRYVTTAFHGTRPLSDQMRKRIYANRRIRLSSASYSVIDTLFSLPEICLYAQMVDLLDRWVRGRKDYRKLYQHVRHSVDEAHADGSIKRVILRDPGAYLLSDPELPEALHRLRAHGKKTFLLTNSEPAYTHAIMTELFRADGQHREPWWESFDLVVLQAGKPDFFVRHEPFQAMTQRWPGLTAQQRRKIKVGGSVGELERFLGTHGDRILYFGDHTYGDILKSKHARGWRTAMVIQELDEELRVLAQTASLRRHQLLLERRRDRLVGWRDFLRRAREGRLGRRLVQAMLRRLVPEASPSAQGLEEQIALLDAAIRDLEDEIERIAGRIHAAFNPYWGGIFKAGRENSHFGAQVRSFACIYTSRVSNFLNYPVDKYFQAPHEFMPHEM
jgi:HAD superfamily 5'-nucleotidase-like hydrolase